MPASLEVMVHGTVPLRLGNTAHGTLILSFKQDFRSLGTLK